MIERVGTVDALVLKPVAGVTSGQKKHSAIVRAMKPRSGSASLANPTSWFHLIGKSREAPLRRWWGFADRLDRAGQTVSQGFPDPRMQLGRVDAAWLILPCSSSDKTGAWCQGAELCGVEVLG